MMFPKVYSDIPIPPKQSGGSAKYRNNPHKRWRQFLSTLNVGDSFSSPWPVPIIIRASTEIGIQLTQRLNMRSGIVTYWRVK